MLTDEQLIERIRTGLRTELSELHPPGDVLDRVHQPVSSRRPWSAPSGSLRFRGRRRLLPSAGAVLATVAAALAVVVAVFALAVLGHGRTANTAPASSFKHGHRRLQPEPQRVGTAVIVETLLFGLPQAGRELGNPAAPVTIVFFGDLECPLCRYFANSSLAQLISKNVRDGTVKIIFRSFCTSTCNGPGRSVFNTQQAAAYAAGVQHLFWDYALLFYREQGEEATNYVNASYLTRLAKQIPGLNLERWQTERGSPVLVSQVNADERLANSERLIGTPTLIISGPKGKKQIAGGVALYSDLQRAITQVR
jgi:protein-disulfide isomerase